MSQVSQQELQRQLYKLGWTIGQQKREPCPMSEAIPMRLLSMNGQREEFLEDNAHEAQDNANKDKDNPNMNVSFTKTKTKRQKSKF